MRILIASDIHGSAYFCEKMIKAFQAEKPDALLLLGDILYHGPRNDLPRGYSPKEVIGMLNPIADRIVCVRGNCDAEVDQMVLNFSLSEPYKIIEADGLKLFATHGHLYNTDNPPDIANNYILLNGHTHIPACERHGDYMYINPGSVSIPKNGSAHSYIMFNDGLFIWKDLDGAEYMRFKA